MYRDHREGPGSPPSGATGPEGLHGPSVGGDQPQVGWCAPHKGPRRLGFGEGAPTLLGGQVSPSPPLGRPPRWDLGLAATPRRGNLGGGAAPPPPLYILVVLVCQRYGFNLLLGTALPLSLLVSCGAWRSPAGVPRSSTTTMPLCCYWMESSSTSPSLLVGSRRGRRHRAVHVLNAEVPSVRH